MLLRSEVAFFVISGTIWSITFYMNQKSTQKIKLYTQKRVVTGNNKVKALRIDGVLPAVVYGKEQDAISLQMPIDVFKKAYEEAGESRLINLYINDSPTPLLVIIHDVALDPISDEYLHVDFYKVCLDEKMHKMIPVEFVGESSAVRDQKGVFVRNINELEVEAFPEDLPSEIKIDISVLKSFGDQILVKDVNAGSGIELLAGGEKILAIVQEPKSQEELEAELSAPTSDVSTVEEIRKEKTEDEKEKVEEAPDKESKNG